MTNASSVEETSEVSMIPGGVQLFAFDAALLCGLFFEEVSDAAQAFVLAAIGKPLQVSALPVAACFQSSEVLLDCFLVITAAFYCDLLLAAHDLQGHEEPESSKTRNSSGRALISLVLPGTASWPRTRELLAAQALTITRGESPRSKPNATLCHPGPRFPQPPPCARFASSG